MSSPLSLLNQQNRIIIEYVMVTYLKAVHIGVVSDSLYVLGFLT